MAYAAGHALNGNATHAVRSENAHIGEPSSAAGGPTRRAACGSTVNYCTSGYSSYEITCPRCRSKIGLGRNEFNKFGERR
jgi:hypothetical protein